MNVPRPLRRLGTLDLRALALFRMALGMSVLYDVATRLSDFTDHYTQAGFVPVELAYEIAGRTSRLYLPIWAHESDLLVAGLFGLLTTAGLAMVVGFHTRIASILCWLLIASLQIRNPLVASFGGDTVLRILLFWAMFMPLGRWYSLDARRAAAAAGPGKEPVPTQLLSVASVALLVQMTVLYVTTGFAKFGGLWASGDALWYALQCDYFGNSFGVWLRDQEMLLVPLSFVTVWVEKYAAILLWVPFATGVFRMAAFVLFVGFHVNLAMFMDVGPFPLYTMAVWPAFLPSDLFDRWLPWLRARLLGDGSAVSPAPQDASSRLSQPLWLNLFAGFCLFFVVAHVATSAQRWRNPSRKLPTVITLPGKLLQLQQNWDMFGPNPTLYDIWPLVAGEKADGTRVDLLSGKPFARHRPANLPDYLGSFRARLYFRALYWENPPMLPRLEEAYAHSRCLRSVADGGVPLQVVSFAVGIERTMEDGPDLVRYESKGRVVCP